MDRKNTFKEKLYECDKHVEKIEDAKEYLEVFMPLTLENYLKLDKIANSFIDQLVFRFLKLQDTMGESLLKTTLKLSYDYNKQMSFIDILNRLEELELLEKQVWLELRELRNDIAHEYSFNQEEVVQNINNIYKATTTLIAIYTKVKAYAQKQIENNSDIVS
jgi:hypothetical protein